MAEKKAKAAKVAPKAEEKKVQAAAAKEKPAVKKAAPKKAEQKPKAAKTEVKAVKKAAPKKSVPAKAVKEVKAPAAKEVKKPEAKAEPKEKNIFKAIQKADLANFTALVASQKNKRGEYGRTPLMTVCLIRSNPRMTDGSNYETKRVTSGKEIYDKMYQLLIDAGCDTNAMDDAGNTAREYNYGGILNQMLAD